MGALVHDGLLVRDRPTATNLKVVIRFAVLQRLSPAVKPGMYDKVYWWGYCCHRTKWPVGTHTSGGMACVRPTATSTCSKRMTLND
jgi:hypothetical protein